MLWVTGQEQVVLSCGLLDRSRLHCVVGDWTGAGCTVLWVTG